MGRILQLSKNVINQIAAGEVIERPYSVVKELAENSADAGATKISIEISNDCRDIRVADNGSGIHPDDIVLAFSKHATSKIKTGEDLSNIHTLGFRGEALASIISISKLTCTTRTADFDHGTKVVCENSEVNKTDTGCAVGTIMEVKDLFYNLPARLKFLKSPKTEFGYINEFIQTMALIHPEISFELKFNGKTMLKTTAQNNRLEIIKEIYSPETASNLREVSKTDKLAGLRLSGYISTPDFTRASKKDYYLYVNSRPVKCPVFQKAIDTVYRNLIGNGRHPFVVLNLEIPTADVDVNVHPTKKEVRYKNTNQIFNFVYSAVDSSLKTNNTDQIPQKSHNESGAEKDEEILADESFNISEIFSSAQKTEDSSKIIPMHNNTDFQDSKPGFSSNDYNRLNDSGINPRQNYQKPYENYQSKLVQNDELEEKDIIIGQYQKTYILVEKPEGLLIVDQHIAEERYIYETLKKSHNVDCQMLFISDVIEISPTDKDLLENSKDKLNKFGYDIEFLSDKEVIFRKVPQILSKVAPSEILADILENIHGNINNIEEQILITTSCKAAVKANTYLSPYRMEEIIRNWRTCENPETCPHGRPIAKLLEHKEIAKFFMRNK